MFAPLESLESRRMFSGTILTLAQTAIKPPTLPAPIVVTLAPAPAPVATTAVATVVKTPTIISTTPPTSLTTKLAPAVTTTAVATVVKTPVTITTTATLTKPTTSVATPTTPVATVVKTPTTLVTTLPPSVTTPLKPGGTIVNLTPVQGVPNANPGNLPGGSGLPGGIAINPFERPDLISLAARSAVQSLFGDLDSDLLGKLVRPPPQLADPAVDQPGPGNPTLGGFVTGNASIDSFLTSGSVEGMIAAMHQDAGGDRTSQASEEADVPGGLGVDPTPEEVEAAKRAHAAADASGDTTTTTEEDHKEETPWYEQLWDSAKSAVLTAAGALAEPENIPLPGVELLDAPLVLEESKVSDSFLDGVYAVGGQSGSQDPRMPGPNGAKTPNPNDDGYTPLTPAEQAAADQHFQNLSGNLLSQPLKDENGSATPRPDRDTLLISQQMGGYDLATSSPKTGSQINPGSGDDGSSTGGDVGTGTKTIPGVAGGGVVDNFDQQTGGNTVSPPGSTSPGDSPENPPQS